MRIMLKIILTCIFALITWVVFPNTFLVTSTNDSGTGSLREAIQNANIYPGSHIINFNIPVSDPGYNASEGIWVMTLTSDLPIITHSNILIDGTSQTVFAGNPNPDGPEILLDANNAAWADFAFHIYNVSGVTIKGFIIGRFVVGIQISGNNAQNDTIAGNYIGCNYNATDTLGNTHGIYIMSGPHDNVIGGNSYEQRNIVSGNNHVGIRLVSSNYNVIQGNFVGLNRTGNAALRNYDGISIEGTSQHNLIGGYTPAERNYVAGNVAYGIPVFGAGCNYNIIAGNFVGTDTTGTYSIPNTYGVLFDDGASYNTLGGRTAGAGNLLSGNSGYGVFIYNFGTLKDTVVGNLIGTDVTGTFALPNANGIVIDGPSSLHTVDNNVISGNIQMGIDIHIAGSDSNIVINNKIGTDISGTLPLGNQLDGIRIGEGPKHNIIGQYGKGNIIAYNGENGITVMTSEELYNTFSANSIYDNNGIGIDLFPVGPTPNDVGDTDTGPNDLMNYPDISTVTQIGSTNNWIVTGTLDNNTPAGCRVELFKAGFNGSGNAQGKTYLGTCLIDGSGNFIDTISGVTLSDEIVATTTDINGNTSEFSEATPLSINNHSNISNLLRIFPNPATDYIQIQIPRNSEIIIWNIQGQQVKKIRNKEQNKNFRVNVESLPAGIYFVKLITNNNTAISKFVKK